MWLLINIALTPDLTKLELADRQLKNMKLPQKSHFFAP